MEAEGIISRYAIAGAVAAYYYIEPIVTEDLGILVGSRLQYLHRSLPQSAGPLASFNHLHRLQPRANSGADSLPAQEPPDVPLSI